MNTFIKIALLLAFFGSSLGHVFNQRTIAGYRETVARQHELIERQNDTLQKQSGALNSLVEATNTCTSRLISVRKSLEGANRQMEKDIAQEREDARVMKLCSEFASRQ